MKKRGLKRENGRKDVVLFLPFLFLLAVISTVLGILCLGEIKQALVSKYFILFAILYSVLMGAIALFFIRKILKGARRNQKGIISVYLAVILFLTIGYFLLKCEFFEGLNSPEKLQELLERSGVWMPICYIILQFLQVIILPIPSIVSTLAGVAIFGSFGAMLYSLIGILLGSVVAFFVGRRLGYKAVAWMVGEESVSAWQKKLKGKDNLFLTVMFVLPFFPDDILCFLAGLSTMTTRYFLMMVFIARFLGIFTTCYSFNFIPFNRWWGLVFWAVIVCIIIVLCVLMSKKADEIQSFFHRLKEKFKKKG